VTLVNGSGLCVGASRYGDRELVALPEAAQSAREMLKVLDRRVFPATASVIDPAHAGATYTSLTGAVGR